jgi:hypothetical protein
MYHAARARRALRAGLTSDWIRRIPLRFSALDGLE